jgi:hypothetical protein
MGHLDPLEVNTNAKPMTEEELAEHFAERAEWLRRERERYEYLLLCAAAAEDEELAWETIVAKMTVWDFVTAAKEVLAFRAEKSSAA